MTDTINPFAAPQTAVDRAAEHVWLVGKPGAMRKVKIGLTLVYLSTALSILAMLGAGVLMALINRDIANLGTIGDVSIAVFLLGVWLAGLVTVAGHLFCVATPRETRARWLVAMTLACDASFFLLMTASAIWSNDISVKLDKLLGVMCFASIVASFLCFALYLRRVACFGRRIDIARHANHTLAVGTLAVVLALSFTYFLYLFESDVIGLGTLQVVSAICTLSGLAALAMYAYLAFSLRKAIAG